jgi:hypothetical protein
MCALGLGEGHQLAIDAAIGGLMMLAATGVFMRLRHRVPFRAAGAWFTATPLERATADAGCCGRRVLAIAMLGEAVAIVALAIGLSYLSGFWLTYMDCGVWAVAIGVIKLGPARVEIAEHEARNGTTYVVARRRMRGLVDLTEATS